jgi:hypothetical protein
MSKDLAKKFYVGQPVWLIREFKVEALFIGDLEKSVTLITTKVPGPETRYRVAGDGSVLFTNEVEASPIYPSGQNQGAQDIAGGGSN